MKIAHIPFVTMKGCNLMKNHRFLNKKDNNLHKMNAGGVEKSNSSHVIASESIEDQIIVLRGQKVMIDRSLAVLYGVSTRHLKRQVRRNIDRFPEEFMFRLTKEEKNQLVPNWHQFRTLKHTKSPPYAFTEHGIAMLASVLNSELAIRMSIIIIKTFIKLRKIIVSHKELASKLAELEHKIGRIDQDILAIFNAIRQLMKEEEKPKNRIGFLQ